VITPRIGLAGEVFGLRQLAAGLALPDCSAPETLLAAGWRRWGPALFERLDGPFAMALDLGDETVLYRDSSGLHPLFWQRGAAGAPHAATRLRDLLPPGAPLHIDRAGLHEYLRLLDIAAPATIVHGVQALLPGQCLHWPRDRGEPREHRVGAGLRPGARPPTFDEAVQALDDRLRQGVATCLEGAQRPAAFLSGGIDSSLLCAVAAGLDRRLTAVTVGFEGAGFDEAPAAAAMARHLGVAHEVLRFGHDEMVDALSRLCATMDQPMADPATPATLLAFEHCTRHFDVVLDGTGADEAVGALPPRHARLAVGYGSLLPAGLRRPVVKAMRRAPALARYTPLLDFEHPAEVLMRWKGFKRHEIEALCGEAVPLAHTRFHRVFEQHGRHAHLARYSALIDTMPCDRLAQALAASTARVRFPFAMRAVDGLLRSLAPEWHHRPGRPKRVLRRALARHAPPELWDRPKQGFTFPLEAFLRANGHALVRHHLDPGRWRRGGLLRSDEVQRYAQAFIGGEGALAFRVWALVVMDCWLSHHGLQH